MKPKVGDAGPESGESSNNLQILNYGSITNF